MRAKARRHRNIKSTTQKTGHRQGRRGMSPNTRPPTIQPAPLQESCSRARAQKWFVRLPRRPTLSLIGHTGCLTGSALCSCMRKEASFREYLRERCDAANHVYLHPGRVIFFAFRLERLTRPFISLFYISGISFLDAHYAPAWHAMAFRVAVKTCRNLACRCTRGCALRSRWSMS